MNLKVGDTVEILGVKEVEDLEGQPYHWDKGLMPEFIGGIATIAEKLRDGWYELDVDENRHAWNESWLRKIDPKQIPIQGKISFMYTNYKGVKGRRLATVHKVIYGKTEFHPNIQFLLLAYCHDKKADRAFAISDMSDVISVDVSKC